MNEQIVKKRPLVGIGVVVVKEGKVLLGKRRGSHGVGEWSFAGGHLELKESVEECAKRELQEETDIKALSLTLGPWTEDLMENDKHYITLFVFVTNFEGEPKLMEPHKCEGWDWFPWENLPTPLFSPIRSLISKLGLESLTAINELSVSSN